MKEYIGTNFHRQTSWGRKIGAQIHQNRDEWPLWRFAPFTVLLNMKDVGVDKSGQLIYSHNSGSSRRNSKELITNIDL